MRSHLLALAQETPDSPSLAPEPVPEPPAPLNHSKPLGRPRKAVAPVQAPTPAPTPEIAPPAPPQTPVRAFGQSLATGLGEMMEAVATKLAHEMANQLEDRVRHVAERVVGKALEEMASYTQALVKATLEQHLGAGIDLPTTTQTPGDLHGAGLSEDVLKMDVVGLIGSQITEVRQQLNGHADAIRFIDASQVGSWEPRERVILNTKFASHIAKATPSVSIDTGRQADPRAGGCGGRAQCDQEPLRTRRDRATAPTVMP